VYPLRKAIQLTAGGPLGDLDDIDLAGLYAYPDARGKTAWVRANMIGSIDGMATVAGRSGELGSTGDRQLFGVVRALADVVVVGARTAITEGYGPVAPHPALSEHRVAAGRAPAATLALVSNTLAIPVPPQPDHVMRAANTVVVTCHSAPDDARAELRDAGVTVVDCGDESVDLSQVLDHFAAAGLWRVLCEGGPALLGSFLDADLIDELCVTMSPLLTAGEGKHLTAGGDAVRRMRRTHVLADDEDYLYLRWVRDQD
jgi:riboflavin biosynthesis pyrimidine reductase